MPFVIRPNGDADLSNATMVAETALPQTISGIAAGSYQVGRLVWAADPATVTSDASDVVFTDDVSDGAGTPMAITTSLETDAVWQRGKSVLALAGTYDLTGDPTGIAWRVGSGAWRRLASETIGSGSWSGTLDIPANYLAQGALQVKPINGENVTPAIHASATVTDVMLVMGQSNADGYATNLQDYEGVTFNWMSAVTTGGFAPKTADPAMNSHGSHWPHYATELDSAGIPPATYGSVTIDGSGFANNDWNETDLLYSQAVSRNNTRAAATGGFAAVHWVQGESDANSVAAGNAWEAAFAAMVEAMVEDVPALSGVPWIITVIGEKNGASGIDAVRESILNVIDGNSWAHHGPNLLLENFGDNTHYGRVQGPVTTELAEAQLRRIGAMTMRATNGALYGSSSSAPPVIDTITIIDANTLTVTFDRAMQNHADATGWKIIDANSGTLTITGAAQGATTEQVVLTTSEDMYGDVTLSFGEDNEGVGGTLTDVDATAPYPPRYTYRTAAGTGLGRAPTQDEAPALVGTPREGDSLTATPGTYSGTPMPTVSGYQWQVSDNGTSGWSDISGATSTAYTPVLADVGRYLRRGETLTSAVGTETFYTAASAAVLESTSFVEPSDNPDVTQWWTATAGVTEDPTGKMSTWANQIGTGRTLSRNGGETYAAGLGTRTLNGLNVLDFDGANDRAYSTPAITELPNFSITANNASSFYGKLDDVGSGQFTDAAASATPRHGAGLWEVVFDATANTATLILDGTQIAQATDYTGTESGHVFLVVDIDGSGNANDAILTNAASDGISIMKHSGAQCGDGGVGEVVICNAVQTGDDLTDMRTYLSTRWGL